MPGHVAIHFPTGVLPDILILPVYPPPFVLARRPRVQLDLWSLGSLHALSAITACIFFNGEHVHRTKKFTSLQKLIKRTAQRVT